MTFLITCSKCSHKMNVPDRLKGKKARCKSCKASMVLEPSDDEPELALAEPSDNEPEEEELELEIPELDEPVVAVAASADDRISVECGQCANVIRVPPSFAGKQGQCSKCGQALTIPGGPIPEAPVEVPLASTPADDGAPVDPLDAALDKLGEDDALDLMITVPCPKCGQVIRVPEAYAGKMGRCKGCQTPIKIPGGEEPEPVKATKAAPGPNAGLRAPRGSSLPAANDGPVGKIIANPKAGLGKLIFYAFATAGKNFLGIYRFAFLSNLAVYGILWLALEALVKIFGPDGLRNRGSVGPAQIAQGVVLVFVWSSALTAKAGLASITHGYLMASRTVSWSDGFGEVFQILKSVVICGALALLVGGGLYGVVLLDSRSISKLVGLALPVVIFLILTRLLFVPNEMTFQSDQGPIESVLSVQRLLTLKRWLAAAALTVAKIAAYSVVGMIIFGFIAASKLDDRIPRDPTEAKLVFHAIAACVIIVMSIPEAVLEPLFGAFYLRFRLSPAK